MHDGMNADKKNARRKNTTTLSVVTVQKLTFRENFVHGGVTTHP
jgi:hypothetical protein